MMRGGGRSRRSAEEAQQLRSQSVLSGFWSQALLITQFRVAFVVVGIRGVRSAASRSLMALKAEAPLMDYTEVTSAISRFREKEKMAVDSRLHLRPSGRQDGALVNPVEKGQYPFSDSDGQDEVGISWKQEYLVAEDPDDGRLVCMVCGGFLAASGPAAARQHILQQHAHSLDFTLEEKRNILEGWSEGAVLPPTADSPPSSAAEGLHVDAERRLSVRQRPPAKDSRGQEPMEAAGKEWLSECGLPSSAPAEIRIFTDGSFPAGFTLKLYCRSQPEPSQGPGAKANTRKKAVALRVDGDHPVVLHPSSHLRLHAGQLGGEDAGRDTGVEVRFELQKLPHEVQVGRDDGPAALDVLVGVAHGHQGVLHQVGDDDGGRARDASLAVDKDSLATLVGLLWSWGEKRQR
uniref:SPIN-DOC-like zinc-finger domain-containing protein n=1 Tax=Naja naja TaxID=35670 RepID=A0A8C6XAV8_NAJNA